MAFDLNPLIDELVRRLRERGETVVFAESCTGGLLSALVTELPGVSDVYLGSIVAYAYAVKESELGVSRALLLSLGAVSTPVARQMAVGVRRKLSSTWSVSITGIAGPGGGTDQKPVGTVCFGVSGPGVEKVDQQLFSGNRQEVRLASAEHALRLLLVELGEVEDSGS
jgi:nicotinamide-nucleotide amidase